MIQVTVNGSAHRLEHPLDVAALLARLDFSGEEDRRRAQRRDRAEERASRRRCVADGDRLEIVVAVGGG